MKNKDFFFNYHAYEDKITYNLEWTDYATRNRNKNLALNFSGEKNYKGQMTKSGKKLIEKRLTAWLTSMIVYNKKHPEINKKLKHLPTFITLTLSDDTTKTDKELKRQLLELFLKQIKYNYDIKHIFWKAEKQKNGRLHFHLVADNYIPAKKIQIIWNKLQKKIGLIENYKKKYGGENPPSTHVKAVDRMKKPVKYCMKYVSKDDKDQVIDGAVFRFSNELLNLKPYSFLLEKFESKELNENINKNITSNFDSDWYGSMDFKNTDVVTLMPDKLKTDYEKYYLKIYDQLYKKQAKKTEQKQTKTTRQIVKVSDLVPDQQEIVFKKWFE